MEGVIYCYHCIHTGKKYIGQTLYEERRKRDHLNQSYVFDRKFYRAVKKYGWNNFIYGIIETVDDKQLDDREMYFIDFYDTYKNGYNMTIGGGVVKICGLTNWCKENGYDLRSIKKVKNKERKKHKDIVEVEELGSVSKINI